MSSNTYVEELMPRIIANSRKYLRRQAAWLPLINTDFSMAAGKIGQKVDIPIPQPLGVQNLTAGQLPPVAAGKDFSTAQLILDKAKISEPFTVEQIHLQNYKISGENSVLQEQINAGIDAVIGDLAADLWSKYYQIPTFAGTGGLAFFQDADTSPSINKLAYAHRNLFQQRVPVERPKMGVFGFEDWVDLRQVQEVKQAFSIGTTSVIQNNVFPQISGFGLREDYFAPTHTAGTIAGTARADATLAGAEALLVEAVAGNIALKKGDIITVVSGGTTYQYSLTADLSVLSGATGSAYLDRPLEANAADDDVVALATNFASGRMGICGDMLGASAVTRLPEDPTVISEMPVKIMGTHVPITDPVSGVSVLLSFFGQYFQRTMHTSLVYGTAITDPRRLTRALSA